MSILEEVVFSQLDYARPGHIERRGGKVVAPILFSGGKVWRFDDREELIALITVSQQLLREMDDAIRQDEHGPAPARPPGPMSRPYTATSTGAHAAPRAAALHGEHGQAVVPDPPRAAAAP
jgi:hypothetical protein